MLGGAITHKHSGIYISDCLAIYVNNYRYVLELKMKSGAVFFVLRVATFTPRLYSSMSECPQLSLACVQQLRNIFCGGERPEERTVAGKNGLTSVSARTSVMYA